MEMNGVGSAVTLIVRDRKEAARADVVKDVRNAEIVFFAGGDQCNYIRWIKGTRAHRAVERLFRRGGGVGGNSAGLAINSSGTVVGTCGVAAMWDTTGARRDLNTLISKDSGWLLSEATSINDAGQIVGYGLKLGELHGFLLTPLNHR